jgi:pimeloyl-ACP methyl ester carboxylesterase
MSAARRSVAAMDVILIPGFWLDASSWQAVTPALEQAGHRPHPVTLPGLESVDADRTGIGLADHVDAVVRQVEALPGPVALVGHSGGGAIAQGVADRLPERIARVVFVDAGPIADGDCVNDELPVVGDEIPLPDWSVFEDADLTDLDDELRSRFRERAVPEPARVASDPLRLSNDRRHDVPVTIIACEFPSSLIGEWLAAGKPWVRELAQAKHVDYLDLPTGHWPQFTRPAELGRALVEALAR